MSASAIQTVLWLLVAVNVIALFFLLIRIRKSDTEGVWEKFKVVFLGLASTSLPIGFIGLIEILEKVWGLFSRR